MRDDFYLWLYSGSNIKLGSAMDVLIRNMSTDELVCMLPRITTAPPMSRCSGVVASFHTPDTHSKAEVTRAARALFEALENEPNVYDGWNDVADHVSSKWALIENRGYDVDATNRAIRMMADEIKAAFETEIA